MIGIIIRYRLKQETDLLHFQHSECGATLRASEIKPKLDRFLIRILGGEETVNKKFADWLIGDHLAFDYKLSFIGKGVAVSFDSEEEYKKIRDPKYKKQNSKIPKSYYGNMIKYEYDMTPNEKIELMQETFKETMRYPDGIVMKIVSFNSELLKLIDKHIIAFFLIHNFGTRQNKGFGSFKISDRNDTSLNYNPQDILLEYSKLSEPRFFYPYVVDYSCNQETDLMDEARWIYSLLKSGINRGNMRYSRAYIYQYFHSKKICNEKAWMKQQGIAPIRNSKNVKKEHENDKCRYFDHNKPRYVRALLGLSDIVYLHDLNKTWIKWPISINDKDKEIMRCTSPITFKIVGRELFILVFEPHPEILGKEFIFEGRDPDTSVKHSGKICVPTADEFNMKELFDGFAKYVNANGDKIRNCRSINSGSFRAGLYGHEIREVR